MGTVLQETVVRELAKQQARLPKTNPELIENFQQFITNPICSALKSSASAYPYLDLEEAQLKGLMLSLNFLLADLTNETYSNFAKPGVSCAAELYVQVQYFNRLLRPEAATPITQKFGAHTVELMKFFQHLLNKAASFTEFYATLTAANEENLGLAKGPHFKAILRDEYDPFADKQHLGKEVTSKEATSSSEDNDFPEWYYNCDDKDYRRFHTDKRNASRRHSIGSAESQSFFSKPPVTTPENKSSLGLALNDSGW